MKFRLSSIPIPDTYTHFNRLEKLRLNTVIIFGLLFIVIMLFVISFRIYNGQMKVALINFSAVILVSFSIFIALKGKLNIAIALFITTLTALVFLFSFTKLLEPIHHLYIYNFARESNGKTHIYNIVFDYASNYLCEFWVYFSSNVNFCFPDYRLYTRI